MGIVQNLAICNVCLVFLCRVTFSWLYVIAFNSILIRNILLNLQFLLILIFFTCILLSGQLQGHGQGHDPHLRSELDWCHTERRFTSLVLCMSKTIVWGEVDLPLPGKSNNHKSSATQSSVSNGMPGQCLPLQASSYMPWLPALGVFFLIYNMHTVDLSSFMSSQAGLVRKTEEGGSRTAHHLYFLTHGKAH